jgi:ABC-2 type transport system ATP-binding protein
MLSAENIHKQFAQHKALDGVSLALKPGSIYGLLGPNGAGKTTLIRILNQIIGPDEGQLYFNGEKLTSKHISRIGYLPEERGLYKKMKVGEQAMYLASLKGLKHSEAKIALNIWFEKFELQGWWNKKVEELSKGMQQKIQFITTLIHSPDVIILDEPFSGFDPVNAALVRSEMLMLRDSGKSILLSTHRMETVESLCDEIALIHKAKVHLSGEVHAIRKRYRNFTFKVLFSGGFDAVVSELSVIDSKTHLDGSRELIFCEPMEEKVNQFLRMVVSEGTLYHFEEILPGMQEIFIDQVSSKI